MRKKFSHKIISTQNGTAEVAFVGDIDEDTVFPEFETKDLKLLVFDLEEVKSINSVGIRDWINWRKKFPQGLQFYYKNCPKVIVDQFNILEGFLPAKSVIESFYVPYYCESCDLRHIEKFINESHFVRKTADHPFKILEKEIPCSRCGEILSVDVIESKYFRFLEKS